MINLVDDIKKSIVGCELSQEGEIRAVLNYASDFLGFQGHFTAQAILPGVCKIKTAICLMNEILEKDLRLKSIKQAKYVSMVKDNENVNYLIKYSEENGSYKVKANVSKGDEKVAVLDFFLEQR